MIAKLAGIIDQVEADAVVIDVGGVGYLVFCSTRTIGRLPPPGLAGAAADRDACARGPHPSLRLCRCRRARLVPPADDGAGRRRPARAGDPLDATAPEQLTLAILAQDKAALTRAEGVGPKLAARIVNELRDKIAGIAASPLRPGALAAGGARRRGRPGRGCGLGAGQSRLPPGRGLRRRRRGGAAARRRRRGRAP